MDFHNRIKSTILGLGLFIFLIIAQSDNLLGQEETPLKTILKLKGKERGDKIKLLNSPIFPKGEINDFACSRFDTANFTINFVSIGNANVALDLIAELEKGLLSENCDESFAGSSLRIGYSNGDFYYISCANHAVYVYGRDTSFYLSGLDGFIGKLNKLTSYNQFKISELNDLVKIDIRFRENQKIVKNSSEIDEILNCLEGARPIEPTGCPFYLNRIYFYSNNHVFRGALAHDLCPILIINQNYFELDMEKHQKLVQILQKHVGFKVGP